MKNSTMIQLVSLGLLQNDNGKTKLVCGKKTLNRIQQFDSKVQAKKKAKKTAERKRRGR